MPASADVASAPSSLELKLPHATPTIAENAVTRAVATASAETWNDRTRMAR
jgi:hypothetical protein